MQEILEWIHSFNKRDSCVNFIAGREIDKSWDPLLNNQELHSVSVCVFYNSLGLHRFFSAIGLRKKYVTEWTQLDY